MRNKLAIAITTLSLGISTVVYGIGYHQEQPVMTGVITPQPTITQSPSYSWSDVNSVDVLQTNTNTSLKRSNYWWNNQSKTLKQAEIALVLLGSLNPVLYGLDEHYNNLWKEIIAKQLPGNQGETTGRTMFTQGWAKKFLIDRDSNVMRGTPSNQQSLADEVANQYLERINLILGELNRLPVTMGNF